MHYQFYMWGLGLLVLHDLRSFSTSGVPRLLDYRGQRGSWMPSKIFSIHPAKFQTTFLSVAKFQDNSLPGCPPPVLHHAPVMIFFSSFFAIYLHFFYIKLAPWMTPRVDARGRRTVLSPLCTPLSTILPNQLAGEESRPA